MYITLDSLKNVCSDIKDNWDAPNDSHTKAEFYGMCVALDMIQKHYQELQDNDNSKPQYTYVYGDECNDIWEVIPECKFLDLYREDFTSDSVWQEVCDVFNKRYKKHITLLTVGIITEEN